MRRMRLVDYLVLMMLVSHTVGCPLLIAGAVGGAAAGTVASAKESEAEHHSAAVYVGTVLVDVVYVPGKILFAAGGALVSGVAYCLTLGNAGTSRAIWNTSVNGDYVLTPRMMEGKEPVRFIGS